MKTIEKIKISKPVFEKTKVAVYARVSLEGEMNQHSLMAQVNYYTKLINNNPIWENVGLFTDYGLSGTKANRPGFQALIKLCEEGKVNLILVKSISRFCRNTIDLLNTVRHLKDLNVNVRFEKENIDTLSSEGELMLTIFASLAQEESRSISENTRWAIQKKFERGIPNSFILYGYKWDGTSFNIVPEQAEIVREIYSSYLAGKSPDQITHELQERNVPSTMGGKFSYSLVYDILRLEKYTGNSILQKTYCKDFITDKRRKNNGEAMRYFAEGTHPAIISQETYNAVQQEIARRRELGYLANQSIKFSCFTGKLVCAYCGRTFRKRMSGMKNRQTKAYKWICANKIEHTAALCSAQNVPDRVLYSLTTEVLQKESFTTEEFNIAIDHIEVARTNTLKFIMKDGSIITKTWLCSSNNSKLRREINGKVCNTNAGDTDQVLVTAN